jgi:thiol-disulfide isomerase/thioredoxin
VSGTVWIVSYVLLWIAVIVLGFTVVALLRQIGVLHTRVAPMGVHFAGEGPDRDSVAPDAAIHDYSTTPVTLIAFTSPTCELCATLVPQLRHMATTYDELELRTVSSATEETVFSAFKVRSTPYLVAVDNSGIVKSRGVANTLDQVEEMLAELLDEPGSGGGEAPENTNAETTHG